MPGLSESQSEYSLEKKVKKSKKTTNFTNTFFGKNDRMSKVEDEFIHW